MKKLNKPSDDYLAIIENCISNYKSAELRAKFIEAADFIIEEGKNFDFKIQAKELHTIQPDELVNDTITRKEMLKLYDDKFAKAGQPGRIHYDKLRSMVPNGRCPLCGIKQISTLDHYLPKAKFPVFAILPLNLIPACRDCNTDKLSQIATCYAEETIHPYYDDIDSDQWLNTTISATSPVRFSFYIEPPAMWGSEMEQRVEKHMEVFSINKLYASHAAEELSNIYHQLNKIFHALGADGVREHLKDGFETRYFASKNSWQTAMYKAMYQSEWFHTYGFRIF